MDGGNLAWQEQRYWLEHAQGRLLYPELNQTFAYGAPMSTPALEAMLDCWQAVKQAADPFLDGLTTQSLQAELLRQGQPAGQSLGSALRRMTYH